MKKVANKLEKQDEEIEKLLHEVAEMEKYSVDMEGGRSNRTRSYDNDVVRMHKKMEKRMAGMSKRDVKNLITNLMETGVPIQKMDCNTRQRVLSTRTYEAISEIFIAYMMRNDPDRFEREPNLEDKTFFYPIDFKVYFYVLYFNAFFEKAKIVGNYGSDWSRIGKEDSIAVPDCLFAYLNAIGGLRSEDGCNGTLQLEVANTPLVENRSIFENYDPARLNSAAYPAFQNVPTSAEVLNFWEWDGTAQEALIVAGEAIPPVTVWAYFDELVSSGKFLRMSSYLSKNYLTKKYCKLYFKGSGKNASPRMPVNSHVVNLFSQVDDNRSVINPFPDFDVYFSSIFTFFEPSPQLFLPHQEFIELPATVPSDEGDALEFEPFYILVEYVQQVQDLGLGINATSNDLWGISGEDYIPSMKFPQKRFVYREINAGALNCYALADAAVLQGQLANLNRNAASGSSTYAPTRIYKETAFISTNYWLRRVLINSPNALLSPMRAAIPKGVESSVITTSMAFAVHQIGRVMVKHDKHSEQYVPYIDFNKIKTDWWSLSSESGTSSTPFIRNFYESPFGTVGALDDPDYIRYNGVRINDSWVANITSLPADRLAPALPFHSVAANFDNVLIKANVKSSPSYDDYSAFFKNIVGGPCMLIYSTWDRATTNVVYPSTSEGDSGTTIIARRMAHTRVGTSYPSIASDACLQIALPLSMDNTTFLPVASGVAPIPFVANLVRGSITGLKGGFATPYENLSAAQFQENSSFTRRVTELQTEHSHVVDVDGVSFYASNDAKCQLLAAFTDLVQSGAGLFLETVSSVTGIETDTMLDVADDVVDVFIAAGNTFTNTKSITDISSQRKRIEKAEDKTAIQSRVSKKKKRKQDGKRVVNMGKRIGKAVDKWTK